MAVGQLLHKSLTHRYREQAPSHRKIVVLGGLVDHPAEEPQAEHQPDNPHDDRRPHEGAHG